MSLGVKGLNKSKEYISYTLPSPDLCEVEGKVDAFSSGKCSECSVVPGGFLLTQAVCLKSNRSSRRTHKKVIS